MHSHWLWAVLAVGCHARYEAHPDHGNRANANKKAGDRGAPAPITVAGGTYTPNAATQYSLGPGRILTPGGKVEMDGSVIYLDASAQAVVVANSIAKIPKPTFTTPPPTLLIGLKTVTALPTQGPEGPTFIVGGKPLTPGGKVVDHGSTISLAEGATAVAINGFTQFLALEAPTRAPALLTFAGKTYTGSSARNALYTKPTFVIDGKTLTPGGEVTVDGTPIALASDASNIVFDGETKTLPADAPAVATNPPILSIGGDKFTAVDGTKYDIDGKTLSPGGTVHIDGTKVSLAPSGTELVVNGKTQTLFPATVAPGQTTGGATATNGGTTSSTSGIAAPGLSAARGLDLAGPLALLAAILGI